MSSGQTLRAVVLSVLLVTSVFAGVVAISEPARAATTSQLDFSGIYNADVVLGAADRSDGDFDNGGYTLVSSSVAQNNGNPAADGVPDDGVIAATPNVHPEFDLADFDSADSNAWQTTGTGSVTASVSPGQYETVHVVASAGGAGPSTPAKFEMQLHYGDGSSETSQVVTVPDWFGTPPGDPGYAVRDGMDRYGTGYDNANDAGIWGYGVGANSSKTLQRVTINVTENAAGSFNFFGGAATTQESDVVNGAPTAAADSATTDEDTSVTVDVVANDSDPDGDTLAVSAITNGPGHGTARITGASNRQIQFDPGENATADVSITYEVSDGNGGTDTATLGVTVTPVNDPPVVTDSSATTDEDTAVAVADGDAADLLVAASDVDGDALSISTVDGTPFDAGTPVTLSGGATVTVDGDGSWRYDPSGQYESLSRGDTATDTFSYTVADGNGGTAGGTVTVTITGVDEPTGGKTGRSIVVGEGSVAASVNSDSVEKVEVRFGVTTTGSVTVTPVGSFPSAAPAAEGRVLGAVDVTPPASAAAESGSLRITVFRSRIEAMGATPSKLRIVRYDDENDELDRLETRVADADGRRVVLTAETPGFSVFGVVVAASTNRTGATATPTVTAGSASTATPSTRSQAAPTTPSTATTASSRPSETAAGGAGFGGAGTVVAVVALAATALARRRD